MVPRNSSAGLDLGHGPREQLIHGAADLVIRLRHALGVEILAHFPKHVVIAGFVELRHHDFLRIGLGLGSGHAELFGGPQAEHLVAPRHRLELYFLVVRELLLKAFLALVEGCHALPLASPRHAWTYSRRLAYRAPRVKARYGNIRQLDSTVIRAHTRV